MSILITGATGQLGSTLQQLLTTETVGMPVYAFTKEQLDITDKRSIHRVFSEYQPKWVLNTAAFTAVDLAETQQEQAFNLNVNAPRYLAEACALINAKLVHFSTDYVFSGENEKPYVETEHVSPQSTYGETKWLGEQAIITTFENYIILRVSWLFSAYGNNFVKTIIRLLKEKDSLRIVQDQQGCPTFTQHIALIVLNFITQNPQACGIFHYCDKPISNWYKLACFIQDQLVAHYQFTPKPIAPITTDEYPTPAIRPKYSVLSCEKILQLPGMQQYNWQDGIETTLRELLS
jgi:dTDP-4-dehydrorhamnose reductase